jgi:hypothetical protein
LANSTISGVSLGGSLFSLTAGTNVTFSTGSTYNGSQAITVNVATGAGYTLPAATTTTLGGVVVPAVATSGISNSSGTIGLAVATTTQLGGVKIDGTSVTISSGVISATPYTLPTATTTVLGGVKVDGTTITINNGVISAATQTSSIDYGQFARYTDFTYTSANTAYALTLDTTAISSGISRGSPTSRIAVSKTAVYEINASVELRTTSNKGVCYLWLRKNGTDVADTNRRQDAQSQDDAINFSYSMLISLAAGDYIELYTAATNNNLYLDFSAATAFAPRTASVLVSVVQVV